MTNTGATETARNAQGFPIVSCYRCGGSGHYSSCQMYGTICFGCSGSGLAIRRGNALKAWIAYTEAVRSQQEATTERLAIGEKVAARRPGDLARYGQGKRFWATVEAIEVDTDHATGWNITRVDGVEVRTVNSYAAILTVRFNDGEVTSHTCSTTSHWKRKAAFVDPAPFLAEFRVK